MKRQSFYFTLLSLITLSCILIGNFSTRPSKSFAETSNAAKISMVTTITPMEITQGESFTITAVVYNHTYKESYAEDDEKLTNPGAEIQFYSGHGNYLIPPTDKWVLPLGSMENTYSLTFTKTFKTADNTPVGFFNMDAVTFVDKDDPNTIDHETQGHAPLNILPKATPPATPPITTPTEPTETENIDPNNTTDEITLDENLLAENSTTTRIDQITKEQLANVENFTLEVVGKNKVVFKGTLDLSSDETIEKLNKLSEYSNLSILGKVSIDTEYLTELKVPATITMYKLPFKQTPLIYKDEELVTTDEVQNIVYIYSQSEGYGTLTFDTTSFSTYEAQDTEESQQETKQQTDTSLARLLLLIALITLQGIIVAVVVKVIQKRRQQQPKTCKVSR